MKILVADKFPAEGIERLRRAGCDVVLRPDLDAASLAAAVREIGAQASSFDRQR